MDFWMLERSKLEKDILTVFSALDGLQARYDWVISDTDLYFRPGAPDRIRERWQWTGLLMDGVELTRDLESGDVWFISGILSALPRGTRPGQVWNYLPRWDSKDFGSPDYRFQTPLTEMELLCYDGYACVIVCRESYSPAVRRALPMAQTVEEFYEHQQ